jgi:type I site-specific restriction-modification system R (restriction) subunit
MPSQKTTYDPSSESAPEVLRENGIEDVFIGKLQSLKYEYRCDITNRATLEANFREKFEALNRVRLTDAEFARLLDEIVTPDVFTASKTLRSINSFTRDDGTPLNYSLVNLKDWCKNHFEVVNQLRINTDNSHHRYDVILLINGMPVTQIELKTLGVNPRRAMEQIVEYKHDPGNGYTKTLLCFMQLFIVSNRDRTYYFANNNARHFAFNHDERFLPVYEFAGEDNRKITHLDEFAERFLKKCDLGRTISRYMVLLAGEQKLMIMRPYQVYAVQHMVKCIEEDNEVEPEKKKEALKAILADYNTRYGTNHRISEFDLYYQDVQKRIKDQQWPNADYLAAQKIDIAIVVDMLLTGFDSKFLNTLYVDKNLKHHGLIQAFSRTNRVLNGSKPYGNILDFRQQQDAVDTAIALFSGEKTGEQAREIWLVEKAPVVIQKLEVAVQKLDAFRKSQGLDCTPSAVANLRGDAVKAAFITHFKEVQRLKTQLDQYTDLTEENKASIDAVLQEENLRGFKGQYLETAKKLKEQQGKCGGKDDPTDNPVDQIDFEFVLFATAALQTLVDSILDRMIFDGERLSDLMAPLDLGWKARTQAELALMADLCPLLTKRAGGRDISGPSVYEQEEENHRHEGRAQASAGAESAISGVSGDGGVEAYHPQRSIHTSDGAGRGKETDAS